MLVPANIRRPNPATDPDYIGTARRCMSAVIRELRSAELCVRRDADGANTGTSDRLFKMIDEAIALMELIR